MIFAVVLALVALSFVLLMMRFGLVSVIGAGLMVGLLTSDLWTDLSKWYAVSSILVILAILGVAGWAFYTSLAGRSLFKDSLFES